MKTRTIITKLFIMLDIIYSINKVYKTKDDIIGKTACNIILAMVALTGECFELFDRI